ncbi:MAG: formylglycine-generating enzyme family protein [Chloroflexi bacterium]|nr:formylglycine-generating enzyme family protein [Chloroflexota bacterium]
MKPTALVPAALLLSVLAACGARAGDRLTVPDPSPTNTRAPTLSGSSQTPIRTPSASPTHPTPTPTPELKGTPPNLSLGSSWSRPVDGMVMLYVPGGEFRMGTDDAQMRISLKVCGVTASRMFGPGSRCLASEFADETPAHAVELDSFWIDRTEVTNAQYQQCVIAGACRPPAESGSYSRESYYGDAAFGDYPVVWVGWQQAVDYCAWVGARLPTEAEWEYAARGPEGFLYPWGDSFDGTRLNYCDANCDLGPNDPSIDDGYPDTAPVGHYPSGASWCGALDMAGNVREWVADWYGPYHGRQVNPRGPYSGDMIVSRGGSWLDPPENVRSTKRGRNETDFAIYKLGIRCAR